MRAARFFQGKIRQHREYEERIRKRKARRNERNKRAKNREWRWDEDRFVESRCQAKNFVSDMAFVSSGDNSTRSYGSTERTSAERPALWPFSSCTPRR